MLRIWQDTTNTEDYIGFQKDIEVAISDITGITPKVSTTGGTSDGRFIAKICKQVVEFGPINASIHKINEHVNIDDIEKLKEIYKLSLIKILCS